jgi:hypothetical protein
MRLLVIASLLLSAAVASATEKEGQFFWQAESGKTFFLPRIDYFSGDIDLSSTLSAKIKGPTLYFGAEQGLNENMSVGAQISYINNKTEISGTSTKTTGLEDIELNFKGKQAAGAGNLRYGATLSLSPGKAKTKANGDDNGYTGGHTLTPMVGYDVAVGSFTVGGKIYTEVGLTDDKGDNAGTETKESGYDATSISFFGETTCEFGHVGASLGFLKLSDSKDEIANTTSTNSKITLLQIYGDHSINEATTLTGDLSYAKLGDSDQMQDGKIIVLSFGATYAF